jgi:hypothetical protein
LNASKVLLLLAELALPAIGAVHPELVKVGAFELPTRLAVVAAAALNAH